MGHRFSSTYASDGLLWGDFSNVNGGKLSPHATHKTGNDIDGFFTGFSSRHAATAAKFITYLNDTAFGSQIAKIFVTFSGEGEDPVPGLPPGDIVIMCTLFNPTTPNDEGAETVSVLVRTE